MRLQVFPNDLTWYRFFILFINDFPLALKSNDLFLEVVTPLKRNKKTQDSIVNIWTTLSSVKFCQHQNPTQIINDSIHVLKN